MKTMFLQLVFCFAIFFFNSATGSIVCPEKLQTDVDELKYDYCLMKPEDKLQFLLCPTVSALSAAKLFEDTNDLTCSNHGKALLDLDINGSLEKKIEHEVEKKCDWACKAQKKEALKYLNVTLKSVTQEHNYLKQVKPCLDDFVNRLKNYQEEMHDQNAMKNTLNGMVDDVFKNADLNNEVIKEAKASLTQKIKEGVDQFPSANYEDIMKATQKEVRSVSNKIDIANKNRNVMKKAWNEVNRGFKMMTGNEKLQKTSLAIGSIAGAVPKFQSGNALQIVTGTMEIATAILDFFPPPASTLAGTLFSKSSLLFYLSFFH